VDRLIFGDDGDGLHLGVAGGTLQRDAEEEAQELLPLSSPVRGQRLLLDDSPLSYRCPGSSGPE